MRVNLNTGMFNLDLINCFGIASIPSTPSLGLDCNCAVLLFVFDPIAIPPPAAVFLTLSLRNKSPSAYLNPYNRHTNYFHCNMMYNPYHKSVSG